MKKSILILALVVCSLALKAQQHNLTDINERAREQRLKDLAAYVNEKPVSKQDSIRKSVIKKQLLKEMIAAAGPEKAVNSTAMLDKMPVKKHVNTDKRMPILKNDRTTNVRPIASDKNVKGYAIYKTKSGADSVVAFK